MLLRHAVPCIAVLRILTVRTVLISDATVAHVSCRRRALGVSPVRTQVRVLFPADTFPVSGGAFSPALASGPGKVGAGSTPGSVARSLRAAAAGRSLLSPRCGYIPGRARRFFSFMSHLTGW